MIVVDVGCHPQGPEESVYRLCDRFRPDVLFGFDPYPDLVEGVEEHRWGRVGEMEYAYRTTIVRRRAAAWTRRCRVVIGVDGIRTGVEKDDGRRLAANERVADGVDLPAFLLALPATADVVLKLDAEGAEYPLLRAIHRAGIDERLERVLVEWHPPSKAHGLYVPPSRRPALRCPVEEW